MTIIIKKDGQILTDAGNPFEGNALNGAIVLLADPQDGDTIVYNATSGMWVPGKPFPVAATEPEDGDTLVYNETAGKWEPGNPFPVNITEPEDGDTLAYDAESGKWVNVHAEAAGGEE